MNDDARACIERVAGALLDMLLPGETAIRLEVRILFRRYSPAVTTFGEGGAIARALDDDLLDAAVDLDDDVRALRQALWTPAGGAFYNATIDARADGTYSVDFDYDGPPRFSAPPSRATLEEDLEKFPRSREAMPAWLADVSD